MKVFYFWDILRISLKETYCGDVGNAGKTFFFYEIMFLKYHLDNW
uniref:Uncharacterized protein n=1 Tax=Phakopsora pachyrhizi TaxID=170000 RepID=A0A0S1MKK2_PHAPC